jgi:hypothetical protein
MHCIALLLGFLSTVVATAAQPSSTRTCRVLFLGASDQDPNQLHLYDGIKSREVELPRLNFSKPYTLPSGPLTLHLLAEPPAQGQPPKPSSPTAKVPEEIGDFYLLVSPDPANKILPVRLQVINAGSSHFKTGQMLWYNLTDNTVGGQVGEQRLEIQPRSKVILDSPAKGNGEYHVNLNYRMVGNDHLYPLCETRWVYDPAARTVFFIIQQVGIRTPRIIGFPDRREDAVKEP